MPSDFVATNIFVKCDQLLVNKVYGLKGLFYRYSC